MGVAWVTTCNKVNVKEVARAKEQLLREKVKELTFKVFIIGYSSHFYLINKEEMFVAAKELGITINLIQYDEEDYINMSEFDFLPDEVFKLGNEDGRIKIGNFFDSYGWQGDMYQVEVSDLVLIE